MISGQNGMTAGHSRIFGRCDCTNGRRGVTNGRRGYGTSSRGGVAGGQGGTTGGRNDSVTIRTSVQGRHAASKTV